jgi:flagellar basal-body rod modification protein FlgD
MDAAATKAGSPTMDKQQFLKLFTSQLKYQDPLNPMDSSEFTSQLAQLTSVEQMMNMNKGIEKLVSMQDNMQRTASTGMIGNLVKLNDGSEGRVMGVRFDEGGPFMLLGNNVQVTMADIKETYKPGLIQEAPKTDSMAAVGTPPDVSTSDVSTSDASKADASKFDVSKPDASKPDISYITDVNGNKLNINDIPSAMKQEQPDSNTKWHNMKEIGKTDVVARGTYKDSKNPDANNNEFSERIENIPIVK